MRLNKTIWRGNYSKWILFGLARDKGAGRAALCPDDGIENENGYPALPPFNYIPDLSCAGRETCLGKPRGERAEFGSTRVPAFRSRWTDVLEPPCPGEGAHSPCAKHVDDPEPNKDHRQHEKHGKEVR